MGGARSGRGQWGFFLWSTFMATTSTLASAGSRRGAAPASGAERRDAASFLGVALRRRFIVMITIMIMIILSFLFFSFYYRVFLSLFVLAVLVLLGFTGFYRVLRGFN